MHIRIKKIAIAIVGITAIQACATSAVNETGLSKAERSTAKEDKRGHKPRPMNNDRLQHILSEYNSNADQSLTWQEFNEWRRNRFNETDSDKNNIVDTEEYVYEFEERLDTGYESERKALLIGTARRFSALDANANGHIEWTEYALSGDKIFNTWDSNNDGIANDSDSSFTDEKHSHNHSKKKANNKKHKKSDKKKSSFSFLKIDNAHSKRGLLALFDGNDDDAVSRDEFTVGRQSTFHVSDSNRNSTLEKDEYENEYENRVDDAIEKSRRASIKQTYVRFSVLDDNDNKEMTFDEFQISGKRIFDRWDKNQDGVVSEKDISI